MVNTSVSHHAKAAKKNLTYVKTECCYSASKEMR